jgi:beta-glucanase (GH16 family)
MRLSKLHLLVVGFSLLLLSSCDVKQPGLWQAEDYIASSTDIERAAVVSIPDGQWLEYDIEIPEPGRYRLSFSGTTEDGASVWMEDYVDNKDGRTYNITGLVSLEDGSGSVDGSPLNQGLHKVRVHAKDGQVNLDQFTFEKIFPHLETPDFMEQKMDGEEWKLVWSDEFEEGTQPDETKWSYNVGNWGWGNFEPQYYTNADPDNARIADGNLIIEAIKNDQGHDWTSARLTTQGKVAFKYGRIEFRAKVPTGRGTWAAGWLLGDSYVDELSWPYCGEIDVLECVGYEIDDSTGNGINHATCHTPAYYFKIGNQISAQKEVEAMHTEFHTYAMEWYPDRIEAYLDGEHYYTYDKTANELEWPFNQPQAIIINLAVGGGWGGAKGIDERWDRHQYILDYVRVYEKD